MATHLTHPGEIPGSRGLLWGFGAFLSGPTHVPVRFTPSAQALAVASGELDPEKLLVATLRAVAATFPRESRAMLARAPRGPLYGVPVTMKDMYSLPWRGYRNGTVRELGRPAASGAFRRLRDAGAVVVGIDNQHELGLGSTGLVSAYAVSAKGGPPAAPGPEADHLCYLDDVWS